MVEPAPLLEVRDLSKSFGALAALDSVSVAIAPAEVVGIIGANGAGKTTFINIVTGYLAPTAGTVRFAGRDITGVPSRRLVRHGVSRSFQVPQLFQSLTARENLMCAIEAGRPGWRAALRQGVDGGDHARCAEILAAFALTDYRDRPAAALPQGVRKILDIAMAMASAPLLLLLDEPTSGVSAEEKMEMMATIMDGLARAGVTVLFVEHDMEVVERFVDRVLAFYQGRIICDAPPAQAMADEGVRHRVIGVAPAGTAEARHHA